MSHRFSNTKRQREAAMRYADAFDTTRRVLNAIRDARLILTPLVREILKDKN